MTTIDNSTLMVKVNADNSVAVYPIYLGQIRQQNPNVSFNETPDIALLNELGYFVVTAVPQSAGDVVTEGNPVLTNGVWSQNWVVRAFTVDEIATNLANQKASLLLSVNGKVSDALASGFLYAFPDVAGHVQLRDGDRANIASMRLRADALTAQNQTAAVIPFRDYENQTHMLTPVQAAAMSDAAYEAYLGLLNAGWTLKDQITAAADIAHLPVIPATIAYPA